MAVVGRAWCDFFVYSTHGYHLEHVKFDQIYWSAVVDDLAYFFVNHVCKEIVNKMKDKYQQVII